MNHPLRPTWIEIDHSAIANNVQQLKHCIGRHCLLMAVVKANAYGHGAVAVSHTVLAAGADRLAVATVAEALELREAGIHAPILVLGYTPARVAQDVIRSGVTVTVYDVETTAALARAGQQSKRPARVHVKVNTGLNRLGIAPDEAVRLFTMLQSEPYIEAEGVYTHFADADAMDKRFALKQFAQFEELLRTLESVGVRPPLAHAANSAATLTLPQTHLQMVRPGIALYGLHPDIEQTRLPDEFRPALSWKARIAQLRRLQPGDAVSYGREFIANKPMVTAVIPVGYADGFPRSPRHWGSVLIANQFAPIIGRVCMDQTIVDVTDIIAQGNTVRQDDEVVLIGRQGIAELSVDVVGQRLRTNNYDVVSRILARVPRVCI